VAASQVFVIVTKSTGTATATASISAKLAVRVVIPPSVVELAAVLAANLNDAVTINVSVATSIPGWSHILPG
jgi:hypothetical protein